MPIESNTSKMCEAKPRNRAERRAADAPQRRFIDAYDVAIRLNISVPSVWRGVNRGSLPAPCYPTVGCARWDVKELDAAVAATKALPRENLAARRAKRLAARPATAAQT